MKKTIASVFFIFACLTSFAQDLLLSEDFDYPIGSNLNQNNWQPLTSARDNPIKIVSGMSSSFITYPNDQIYYSSSGGAAYLNKSGQDVKRSFTQVSNETICVGFQLYPISMTRLNYTVDSYVPLADVGPNNYFMFLSSKEDPAKPLLKFALREHFNINSQTINSRQIMVLNAENRIIAELSIPVYYITTNDNNPFNVVVMYSMTTGHTMIFHNSSGGAYSAPIYSFNKLKINNLANIVLSQSDISVGSIAKIDRIRIGKSMGSVVPVSSISTNGGSKQETNDAVATTLNASIFPNTTDGKFDLRINDGSPKVEIEVKLTDNMGNILISKMGQWEIIKPSFEEVLSKSKFGQYYITVTQGADSKTIRVIRNE